MRLSFYLSLLVTGAISPKGENLINTEMLAAILTI